jgi:hypothetical protein
MRPKAPPVVRWAPAITRPASSHGNRNRTLVIGAALAGVAAIGTPVMWKLAFASSPPSSARSPSNRWPRRNPPRRGSSACTVSRRRRRRRRRVARVYQDLQPPAPSRSRPSPRPLRRHPRRVQAFRREPEARRGRGRA